jgi:hypothetical protein
VASAATPRTAESGETVDVGWQGGDRRFESARGLCEFPANQLFPFTAETPAPHSRQAISQHLDVLESAGLVETRREGRYKFHYLNTEPLEHIADRWLRGDKEGST